MHYKEVTDKSYLGFDFTIYEREEGTYTVDVKKPCGELLYGWEFVPSFGLAQLKAVQFIEGMVSRGVAA